jgi:hypothetical protein
MPCGKKFSHFPHAKVCQGDRYWPPRDERNGFQVVEFKYSIPIWCPIPGSDRDSAMLVHLQKHDENLAKIGLKD